MIWKWHWNFHRIIIKDNKYERWILDFWMVNKAYDELSELMVNKGVKWKDIPKWLKFKMRLMWFIWDWLTWNAMKSGWRMQRLHYKLWKFYRKHPYLKNNK